VSERKRGGVHEVGVREGEEEKRGRRTVCVCEGKRERDFEGKKKVSH
jgi:hypothetical protein